MTLTLPEEDRPGRVVRFRLRPDGEEFVVHPDGLVELPDEYAGTSARQIADELRAREWLPPIEEEPVEVEEEHAYPCPECGGNGCRACSGTGERIDRGTR